MEWVISIGMKYYAPKLKETGVHGGVLALDHDFDHDKLAMALQIPLTDMEVCKIFSPYFFPLLIMGSAPVMECTIQVQWNLAGPTSLGPEGVRISDMFRLVKCNVVFMERSVFSN